MIEEKNSVKGASEDGKDGETCHVTLCQVLVFVNKCVCLSVFPTLYRPIMIHFDKIPTIGAKTPGVRGGQREWKSSEVEQSQK